MTNHVATYNANLVANEPNISTYRIELNGVTYMINQHDDNIIVRRRVMPEHRLYYYRWVKDTTPEYRRVVAAINTR